MRYSEKESIFPAKVVEETIGSLFHARRHPSNTVYKVIIISFLAGIASLPFISVDISIKSRAVIRPASEISSIRSLVDGRVKKIFVVENQYVNKGDILFVLAALMAKKAIG